MTGRSSLVRTSGEAKSCNCVGRSINSHEAKEINGHMISKQDHESSPDSTVDVAQKLLIAKSRLHQALLYSEPELGWLLIPRHPHLFATTSSFSYPATQIWQGSDK